MFKNMSPRALGVSGRQSELLELTLTYGFRGLDIDMADFQRRVARQGIDSARRFIDSARVKVGGWDLPISWAGEEARYREELKKLPSIAEIGAALGAKTAFTHVPPASDSLPYHEHFELLRKRLAEIGDVFKPLGVKLAIGFQATPKAREGRQHEFIHQAEAFLLFLKAVGHDHIVALIDTWHWHVGGGTLQQIQGLSATQIGMVRLADVPGDVDLAKITDRQRLLPTSEGKVNAATLLEWLDEKDYRGPVTPFPSSAQFQGMTRDSIVQRTADALAEIWPGGPAPLVAPIPAGAGMDEME